MRKRSLAAVALPALAALAAVRVSHAANVQFTGAVSNDFTLAGNWADNNPPAPDGDVHFVENGLTSVLTGTASVNGLVVGDISAGTVNARTDSITTEGRVIHASFLFDAIARARGVTRIPTQTPTIQTKYGTVSIPMFVRTCE